MTQTKLQDYQEKLDFEFPDLEGEKKLRELILYIADQCFEDPYFGATKLNKILYHSDFESYKRHGMPITGMQYQRLPEGPAPKHLVPIREEMKRNDDIFVKVKRVLNGKDQYRIIALREPKNMNDLFTALEISIVDEIIRNLWGKTAKQVSEETHGISWEIYKNKELIPYQAVLLSDEMTLDDISRAHELIEEHGWDA